MDIITIIVIAIGLAMDSFSVSVPSGMAIKHLRVSNTLKIAIFFGAFQAIMPLIGWLSGLSLRSFISEVDHWVAFGLLSLIGCKMIYESFKKTGRKEINPLNVYVLLLLSIATSIDALAVGISFAFLRISIVAPIIIGIITFLLSFISVFVGKKFGGFFENKIRILGGLILIGIGTKIFLEHLLVI